MDFRKKPNLLSDSTFKIAIHLWYHVDIWRLLKDNRAVFTEVIGNARLLPIPEPVQLRIISLLGQLGRYIQKWLKQQVNDHKIKLKQINLSKIICWTSTGTVDCRRTAETLISCNILDTTSAFRMACCYCLEEQIVQLWPHSEAILLDVIQEYGIFNEVAFWVVCLNRTRMRSLDQRVRRSENNIFRYGFHCGFRNDNKEFCKYFIQKIDMFQARQIVKHYAYYMLRNEFFHYDSELFLLILSCMDINDRKELFRTHPRDTLLIFMEWPLIQYLLDVAKEIYNTLDVKDFYSTLRSLASLASVYADKEMFEPIFVEFWNNSPEDLRNSVTFAWKIHLISLNRLTNASVENMANVLEMLSNQMFSNGSVVFDMLTGSCCWKTLEFILNKYTFFEPAHTEFLEDAGDFISEHVCDMSCFTNNFNAVGHSVIG